MREYGIIIISGSPASLTAAIVVRDNGIENILILERDKKLEDILNQCIHNRFGLHAFKKELTSPGYAARLEEQVYERNIEYKLNTIAMDISHDKVVTAMNREEKLFGIQARAVILAMGCGERSRRALNIPDYRLAGIYYAGTAQRLVNMEGFIPGREAIIPGSGDVSLIMAEHMTLERARVKVVTKLIPYSGGLKYNTVRCLGDYGMPLKLSYTVVDTRGKERLEGTTLAVVDGKGKPIPGTEEDYTCDTLLLSAGLISENELPNGMGVKMNHVTSGSMMNESLKTSIEGVFACGDVLRVHGLADFVSEETATADKNAVRYVRDGRRSGTGQEIELGAMDGVRYTVPCTVHPGYMEGTQAVRFRAGNVYKSCYAGVYFDGEQVMCRRRLVMASGEMEEIKFQKERLMLHSGLRKITIKAEEA